MLDPVEQDEITQDQNGSIYPQPKSIFDNFEESFNAIELHGDELIADYDKWLMENNNG
jgi:hypothetical protein